MSKVELDWFNVTDRYPTEYENLQHLESSGGKPYRQRYVVQVDQKNIDLVWPCYFDFTNKVFIRVYNGSKVGAAIRWAKLPKFENRGDLFKDGIAIPGETHL